MTTQLTLPRGHVLLIDNADLALVRLCNQSQNKANRPAPKNNTSGFKGVHLTRSGRWAARITVNYRARYLARSLTPGMPLRPTTPRLSKRGASSPCSTKPPQIPAP